MSDKFLESAEVWDADEVYNLCLIFKCNLANFFLGDDNKLSIATFLDIFMNLPERHRKTLTRQLRKVFSDFHMLDFDLKTFIFMLETRAKDKHPDNILLRDMRILDKNLQVNSFWNQNMRHYYRLTADSIRVKIIGERRKKTGVDESGNDLVSIGVAIGNGVTAYAASLRTGEPNWEPLEQAYEQASSIFKHSCISTDSYTWVVEVIVAALNCIAKMLPVVKPIFNKFKPFGNAVVKAKTKETLEVLKQVKSPDCLI